MKNQNENAFNVDSGSDQADGDGKGEIKEEFDNILIVRVRAGKEGESKLKRKNES